MNVLYDEREHVQIGKCENCGKENVRGRRKEAHGMFNESRGFYFFCFDCIGPEITWRHADGRTIVTTVKFGEKV